MENNTDFFALVGRNAALIRSYRRFGQPAGLVFKLDP